MKVTIINGQATNNSIYDSCIKKICRDMDNKKVDYHIIDLNKMNFKGCTGCDSCQSIKPGLCAINDGINEILKGYLSSDIVIIITQIHFGICNSITKRFIDRTEPLFLPYHTLKNGKTIMKNRYDKYPDIIVIGIADDNDDDSIEAFKNTFMNCNLFAESNKINIQIIKNKFDSEKINYLDLRGE